MSTPAALSAPGWLEIEAGVQNSRGDDPSRRTSLPYTLKLAFTPDWGIRIAGDAIVWQVGADGSAVRGGGDTSAVLKRRFAVSDTSAFGLELGVKIPTARDGLGSSRSDIALNAIYSSDFAEVWHTDVNIVTARLGAADAGLSHWQESWAAALSRNLTEQWSVVSELSGTQQSGHGTTTLALVAASYAISRGATLDIGVSKGLSTSSGGWSVFSGITFLAAHLF